MTCQMSVNATLPLGMNTVRSSGWPSSLGRGVPSASCTRQWQAIQVACLLPLANGHVPLTR